MLATVAIVRSRPSVAVGCKPLFGDRAFIVRLQMCQFSGWDGTPVNNPRPPGVLQEKIFGSVALRALRQHGHLWTARTELEPTDAV